MTKKEQAKEDAAKKLYDEEVRAGVILLPRRQGQPMKPLKGKPKKTK